MTTDDKVTASVSPPSRIWSKYQNDLFSFVADEKGNGVVQAVAGSGKSTALEECCHRSGKQKVLVIAFNKTIADAMSKRVPKNATASTLHSFGLRAIKSVWPNATVERDKERMIAQELGVPKWDLAQLCKLVSMAKAWMVDDIPGIAKLGLAYQCLGNPSWPETVQKILEISKESKTGISFDDMIWLPVVMNLRTYVYDAVFVDETQDLNRSQVELTLKAAGPVGRILAVGDSRQSIYHFRGADSASMERLTERLSAKTLPLSITYRCPTLVVDEARVYVPQLEAAPNAKAGIVREMEREEALATIKPGDAVISRTNAPLIRLCLALLRQGVPAWVRGRDIGSGLSALVNKSKTYSIVDFAAWLREYHMNEIRKLNAFGDGVSSEVQEQIELLQDRVDTLIELSEGCSQVSELTTRIAGLFDDRTDENRVLLSSTHRAKGLEFDNVYLLWDTFRPEHSKQEERNLCYVAITRAKNTLTYVTGVK